MIQSSAIEEVFRWGYIQYTRRFIRLCQRTGAGCRGYRDFGLHNLRLSKQCPYLKKGVKWDRY